MNDITQADTEISVMEMKGRLSRTLDGWVCECPDTSPGYGATPEAAYYDWMRLLYQPYAPDDDAYDTVERDYRRLADGVLD